MGTISLDLDESLMLGVDFGTTNTVVSFYNKAEDEICIIPIDGHNIFPTAIMFEQDEVDKDKLSYVFGTQARDGAIIYPQCTVLSIKSLLGTKNDIKVIIDEKEEVFATEQVVGLIFDYIRKSANEYIQTELNINAEFEKIVITVPANSTDKQKRKTIDSAVLGGFNEDDVHIRLEPVASAINYAVSCVKDTSVLVYDFGGGTFDACILDIKMDNRKPVISVKSTSGDNNLGGNDVDKIILDMIYDEFLKITDNKIDLFDSKEDDVPDRVKKIAVVRLTQIANQVKEKLSKTKSAKVTLTPLIQEPYIVNISMTITVDDFLSHRRIHQLNDSVEVFEKFKNKNLYDIIDMTIDSVSECLNSSNVNKDEIGEIFLVGGSSSLPIVHEKIVAFFGKEPYKSRLNPALSISEGASYYTIMIEQPDNTILKTIESTIHSLGIEISGRRYLELIKPNTQIPDDGLTVEVKDILSTNHDYVDKMVIVVYEYTKNSTKNVMTVNEVGMKRLCGTTLTGIPENVKGFEKVSIAFTISRDNVLTVSANSCSNEGISTKLSVDELY